MATPSFNYADCVGTSGLEQGGSLSNTGGAFLASSVARFNPVSAFGALLLLDGLNVNQKMVDATTTSTVWPLVGNAPFGMMAPTITAIGTGRVYGLGYKWFQRFKASTTGEVTGVTALNPYGQNLGSPTTAGTYLGQNALFQFLGRGGVDGAYFDRIQLFRNTSEEYDVFYLVKELANPGSGSSVYFTDDVIDDELLASGVETMGLLPNPSHAVGPPPPYAKAHIHRTARVIYYGTIPMGTFRNGVATIGANANYATITADATLPAGQTSIPRSRVGQRFVPLATSGGTTITPTQEYRVASVSTGSEGDVDIYPTWAEGALSNFHYEIDDDRDTSVAQPSEPGLPYQVDVTKQFAVGADKTDPLLHMWSFRGRFFAITRRRKFVITNDTFLDDAIPRCQEVDAFGAAGMWAMAETPLGLVYVDPDRNGVFLFQGSSDSELGIQPSQPLGGSGPNEKFLPLTQFRSVDPAYMDKTRVLYDPIRNQVFVSYCPLGGGGLEESFAFELDAAIWRGPWRTHLTCVLDLVDDGGGQRVLYGEEFGNLMTADEAALDVVNQYSGQTIAGTIATVTSVFSFTPSAGTYDPNSDKRIVGCPILLDDGAGNVYQNWIGGWGGGEIQLLYLPPAALTVGWSFKIGGLRWQLRTANINVGEPIQPKTFDKMRFAFERGTAGDSTGKLGVAVNGGSSYITETQDDGSTEFTIDPGTDPYGVDDGTIYADGRVRRSGKGFQVRLRGTAVTTLKITEAVADIEVNPGA